MWLYAAHNPQLKAGVAWYGRLVGQPDELHPKHPVDVAAALNAPVLGLYGAADTGIPQESVERCARPSEAASKVDEIIVFFPKRRTPFADYRPSYRADQAAAGWKRMLEWFRKNGVA